MGTIIQYTRIQLKHIFRTHPFRAFFYFISPTILFALIWAITKYIYIIDENNIFIKHLFITVTSFILYLPLTCTAARNLIREKKLYRKQYLYSYGFGLLKYYFSWILFYFILILPTSIIIITVVFFMNIFPNVNIFIVFIVFILFQLSNITIAFWLSVYFTNTVIGTFVSIIGSLLILSSYITITYLKYFKGKKEFSAKNSVLPIGKIITNMQMANITNETIDFDTFLFSNPNYFWFNINILILLGITLIYIILGLFSDLFFLPSHMIRNKKDRWNKEQFRKRKDEESSPKRNNNHNQDYWNGEKNNNSIKIKFSHLFKKYYEVDKQRIERKEREKGMRKEDDYEDDYEDDREEVLAIDDVSFDIYNNEIIAIVGDEGAGKSTLIKMLYGKIPSSYGKIKIGKKILNYWKWLSISKKISVAPKENYVFFENMSIADHIRLYTSISHTRENEIYLLKELNVKRNIHTKIKNLNEIEKKKIKIALSFLNNRKYIFLEEPTTGMPMTDQECFWNVIHARRNNKVIVFTTLSLDEAEQQADHILLLNHGKAEYIDNNKYFYDIKDTKGFQIKIEK